MKKVLNVFLPFVKGFMYCFIILQVGMGLYFLGCNFGTVPQFKDTEIYLEMTRRFVMDEYTGLLYPGLVRLFYGLLGEQYYIPVYLVQIGAGLFCVYHFVCAFTHRKWVAVSLALWINTIPFVLQMHLTILPHSLALSCMILMVQEVLKGTVYKRPLQQIEWAVLFCSFTILCQLTRGYLWVGIPLLLWAVLLQLYADTHKVMGSLILVLVCVGIIMCNIGAYYGTQQKGYYGRIQNTAESVYFRRTAVPVLSEKFMIYMPEEIKECFTGEDMDSFGKYPYKIQSEMGPTLEARYGKVRANEIYAALGNLGMEVAAKDNMLSFLADGFRYGFPAFTYMDWRDGAVKGTTSWNYQQFTENAPVWSTRYFNTSHYLWLVGLCLTVVCFGIVVWQEKKAYLRIWVPVIMFLIVYGMFFAARGTDMYDYKLALLPMVAGYTPLCIPLFMKK